MDGVLGIFLTENSVLEWPAIASGALVFILGGITVAMVQRRWSREDEQAKQEQTALKTELAQLGLGLATERDERNRDITREASERRAECSQLGRDISSIREAFAYYCGSAGKERPKFGPGND